MKLTKTIIDKLTYTGDATRNERCIVWGDSPTGFGLRIYPSGKKAFIYSYRFEGRKQMKVIGTYGNITLIQALDQCKLDVADILNKKNPLAEKKKAALGDTVKQLCELYIAEHASKKKTGDEDERRIKTHIIPAWGAHKIVSITNQDVESLHIKIGKNLYRGKPTIYEANRVLSLTSKLFSFAAKKKMVDANHSNPAVGVEKNKEDARDRYVKADELPELIKAIDNEPNQYARWALWLYLLTGSRKDELLKAKWSDIDFNRKEWRLPDTKNGKTHYLPLSDAGLEVLRKIPRLDGNPYIIVGKNPGCHLVNIDKPWQRIRKQAGVEDVHIHDLRRTVGSWLAQSGNSLHLIGQVLNHSNVSTTKIYARFGQDQVANALNNHGEQILNAALLKPSNE
jgi:integrase